MFLDFCIGLVFFMVFGLAKHKRENQQKGEENIFTVFDFLDFCFWMLLSFIGCKK